MICTRPYTRRAFGGPGNTDTRRGLAPRASRPARSAAMTAPSLEAGEEGGIEGLGAHNAQDNGGS
eukprot:8007482-Alexandrium_andersonii.AAC.1